MVIDRDICQRSALLDLGSLADIRQLQIALCGSDLAEPDNGETKSEWLKRNCIHIVAVTLPRFSILRYQIIHGCLKPPVDLHRGCFCRSGKLPNCCGRVAQRIKCRATTSIAGKRSACPTTIVPARNDST